MIGNFLYSLNPYKDFKYLILIELASNSINAVTSRPYDFHMQIAVGEQGNVYRSWDGGRHWEPNNTGFGENLNDIVSFFGVIDEVLI